MSKTDPEATIVSRIGTYRKLCSKAHYIADASSRCILDCHATTGARHEGPVLAERLDALIDTQGLGIKEVIADKGYGRGPTYSFLREKGVRAYIPLQHESIGKGRLSRGEFIYDRKHDRYVCPNHHHLYPYERLDNGTIKRYRVVGGHCRNCPLKTACLPESQHGRARFVYRGLHQDEIDRIRKRQGTVHFKSKLRERKWKIEGLFGEAKENHCMRRTKYRGLAKMQIQLYMTAIVQNVKRLVSRLLDSLTETWPLAKALGNKLWRKIESFTQIPMRVQIPFAWSYEM